MSWGLGGCPCRWPCPGPESGGEAAACTRSRGSAPGLAPPGVLQHVSCASDRSAHLFSPHNLGSAASLSPALP